MEPELIWTRLSTTPRAPRQQLTAERIAAAAITVADTEGVDAVVMRRVAAELGCGTMSLYRHVRTKDELHDLMIDTAIGTSPPPVEPSGDWRTDLTALAHAQRTAALRHPWLPRLAATRPNLGPHALAATEFALAAVDGLGLPMPTMVRTINTVLSFVHGFVQTEVEQARWRQPPDKLDETSLPAATLNYLQQVTESGRYPRFARMVAETEPYPDTDAEFAWQLDRVLDGLAHHFPDSVA